MSLQVEDIGAPAEQSATAATASTKPLPLPIPAASFNTEVLFIAPESMTKIDGQTYIVQRQTCQSQQFKRVATMCRSCIAREGLGDACRFMDMRAVPVSYIRTDTIVSKARKASFPPRDVDVYCWPPREEARSAACTFLTSPLENQAAELPGHHDLNRAMDDSTQTMLLDAVAQSLLPIMREALVVADMPRCIRRQRELQYRALCDMCTTGIFASSFMCTLCGLEYCLACRQKIVQQGPDARLSDKKPDQIIYCGSARGRDGTLRYKHFDEDLIPVTRFSIDELQDEIAAMESVMTKARDARVTVTGSETTDGSEKTDDDAWKETSHDGEDDMEETDAVANGMAASTDQPLLAPVRVTSLSDEVSDTERLATPADVYPSKIDAQKTVPDVWLHSMKVKMDRSSAHRPDDNCSHGAAPSAVQETTDVAASYSPTPKQLESTSAQPGQAGQAAAVVGTTKAAPHEDAGEIAGPQPNSVAGEPMESDAIAARLGVSEDSRESTTAPLTTASSQDMAGATRCPPSHPLAYQANATLTEEQFLLTWSKGEPMVVNGISMPKSWDPQAFQDRYGDEECEIVRCDSQPPQLTASAARKRTEKFPGYNKFVHVRDFFATFGANQETRAEMLGKGVWKLKDWPPSAEFRSSFPDLYDDFNFAVPMPDYTRRDGCKNLSALFPLNANGPDLGPKMYNAWPGEHARGKKGTTRLHMDIADAVNIMLYASETGEAIGAQWDIFRAEDAQKIREFLWEQQKSPDYSSDPIHVQLYYLDDYLLEQLYKTKCVYSWRIYQRPGQAVFIPAGCAHQVCNLSDCIKVAVDFLSIQNVERCFRLTEEFAALATDKNKSWKEDVLQLRAQLWYAWRTCRQLGPPQSEEEMQQRRAKRDRKLEADKLAEEALELARNKRKSYSARRGKGADGDTAVVEALQYTPPSSTRSGRSVKAPATSMSVAIPSTSASPLQKSSVLKRKKSDTNSPVPVQASTARDVSDKPEIDVRAPQVAGSSSSKRVEAAATRHVDTSTTVVVHDEHATAAQTPHVHVIADDTYEEPNDDDDDEPIRIGTKRRKVLIDVL